MEQIAIAEVAPTLPSPETKVIHAIVTLLWPYSSSTKQCALLLADPDYRLRRQRGQVRVRFSGASATAIAQSGIGIGDEVTLGLRGARFVEEAAHIQTPGKSVDCELVYGRRLVLEISRDGKDLASVDLDDRNPSPEPLFTSAETQYAPPLVTPAAERIGTQRSPDLWSSPAFLKRPRISDGSLFGPSFNTLDFAEDGSTTEHRRKRRKSHRDWSRPWTYSARTPSPEKEGEASVEEGEEGEEEDSLSPEEDAAVTPLRFPRTPISPSIGQEAVSVANPQVEQPPSVERPTQGTHGVEFPATASVGEFARPSPIYETDAEFLREELSNEDDNIEETAQHFPGDEMVEHFSQEEPTNGEYASEEMEAQELENENFYQQPSPYPSQPPVMFEGDTESNTEDEPDIVLEDESESSQDEELEVEVVKNFQSDDQAMALADGERYWSATEADSLSETDDERDPHDQIGGYEDEGQRIHPAQEPEIVVLSSGEESSDEEDQFQEETWVRERSGTQDDPNAFDENSDEEASAEESEDEVEDEEYDDVSRSRERSGSYDDPIALNTSPGLMMPPPNLPFLRTNIASANSSQLQTPVGDAPTTPVLQPLTPSTLPMPSPFPGERDATSASFLDYQQAGSSTEHEVPPKKQLKEPTPDLDQDDIEPSDFYHLAVQNTHPSVYSDIRFSFGFDGAMISRDEPSLEEHASTVIQEVEEISHDIEADIGSYDEIKEAAESTRIGATNEILLENSLSGGAGAGTYIQIGETEHYPQAEEAHQDFLIDYVGGDAELVQADVETDESNKEVERLTPNYEVNEDLAEEIPSVVGNVEVIDASEEVTQPAHVHDSAEEVRDDNQDTDIDMRDVDQPEEEDGHPKIHDRENDIQDDELGLATDVVTFEQADLPFVTVDPDTLGNLTSRQKSPAHHQQQEVRAVFIDLSSEEEEEDDNDDEDGQEQNQQQMQEDIPVNNKDDLDQDVVHAESGEFLDGKSQELSKHGPSLPPMLARNELSYKTSPPRLGDEKQELLPNDSHTMEGLESNSDSEEELPDLDILLSQPRRLSSGKSSEKDSSPELNNNITAFRSPSISGQIESEKAVDASDLPRESAKLGVPPSSRPVIIVDLGAGDSDEDDGDKEMDSLPPVMDEIEKVKDEHVVSKNEADGLDNARKFLIDENAITQNKEHGRTPKSLVVKLPLPKLAAQDDFQEAPKLSPSAPAMNTRSKKHGSPTKEIAPRKNLRSRRQSTPAGKSKKETVEPVNSELTQEASSLPSIIPSSSFRIDNTFFETMDFPIEDLDTSLTPKASTSKLLEGTIIKDSLDDNLHTEGSLSTVPFSDDVETMRQGTYDFRYDLNELETHVRISKTTSTLPPDIESSHSRHTSELKGNHEMQSLGDEDTETQTPRQQSFSSIIPQESRNNATQRTTSPDMASSPPKRWVHGPEHSSMQDAELVTGQVTYPRLPLDAVAASPPATQPESEHPQTATNHEYSLANSNLPMTPDPSQAPAASQSFSLGTPIDETLQSSLGEQQPSNSQPTLGTHISETLPLSPQLTQKPSTALLSSSPKQTEMSPETTISRPSAAEQKLRKRRARAAPQTKSSIAGVPVPAILSEWFAPRSSLAARQSSPSASTSSRDDADREVVASDREEAVLAQPTANGHAEAVKAASTVQHRQVVEPPSQGFRTSLSYFTPLSKLSGYLNMSSQSPDAYLDVIAVVTRDASQPERAKGGPRDYHTIFSITDISVYPNMIQVQVFRPYSRAIPKAQAGDVVLLHNFAVKSNRGKEGLLSSEDSAWRVWRFGKPIWGTEEGRFGGLEAREECTGPPAEVGDEERAEVEKFRAWWESVSDVEQKSGGDDIVARRQGRRLRSQL